MIQFPDLTGSLDDDRLSFRHVPVQNLRDVWPTLQHGLQVVKQTNGESWIPEDVYAVLLHGRAALYAIYDGEELEGFGIYEVLNFAYEFKPRLNIWIGWSRNPAQGHLGVELSRRIARAMGIDSIVFSTTQENRWVDKFKKLHTWYEV